MLVSGNAHLILLALQPRHISFEYFSLRRLGFVSAMLRVRDKLEVGEGARDEGNEEPLYIDRISYHTWQGMTDWTFLPDEFCSDRPRCAPLSCSSCCLNVALPPGGSLIEPPCEQLMRQSGSNGTIVPLQVNEDDHI